MAENDGPPPGQPVDSGVIQAQQAPPPDTLAVIRTPDDLGGIQPSRMAAAFQEAQAFKNPALQVFAKHWAEDVHGRLLRTEAELKETREKLDEERDKATRFDDRLTNLQKDHDAQDRLKVLGGAVIGAGVTLLFEGKYGFGIGCVVVGFVLAYGVPSSLPWKHGK
jgi:hypothetical protein